MPEDQPPSMKDFGASFIEFLQNAAAQAPPQQPVFLQRLRAHFNADPALLPIIAESFETADHPNLHLAIEGYLSTEGRSAERIGLISGIHYMDVKFSQLVAPANAGLMGQTAPAPGPVEYVNINLEDDRVLTCVQRCLFLVSDADQRLALLLCGPNEMMGYPKIHIEVMAQDASAAERVLAELRSSMRRRNVYRGHVISLGGNQYGAIQVQFHRLPEIERKQIILPQGLLELIERQTLSFSRHSEKMLAAGRHLKRGLLLHGPPGTGKTLTAMYLAGQMRDRTVLLLTGRGLGMIERSCSMARMLQPSMVILEDVDLVGAERTHAPVNCGPLLFELLNEMDRLADDADVMFFLTTNRPDILEPALAARPGRIDQAIEIPLPDEDCQRRLFEFYGRGLTLRMTNLDSFIARTRDVSPAFIRELLRKAALFAADEDAGDAVEDRHVEDALRELVVAGGELTKRLLGARDILS